MTRRYWRPATWGIKTHLVAVALLCLMLEGYRWHKAATEQQLQDRIAQLIEKIDLYHETGRLGYTNATNELESIGRPAVLPLLDALLMDHHPTLAHLQFPDSPSEFLPDEYEDQTDTLRRLTVLDTPASLDACEAGDSSEAEGYDYNPKLLEIAYTLHGISMREFGFVPGKGWQDPDGLTKWRAALGEIDYDASLEERRKTVAKWRRWFDSLPPE